jgi:hypothetical protein
MILTFDNKFDQIDEVDCMFRSPFDGKLSNFSFYIDSQISVRRSLKNRSIDNLETQKKYISRKFPIL